jgi:hypothetical protein
MAYVGNPIDTQNTFQSLVGKRFSGDGSTTAFTLDVAPSSTLDIEVFVGNVRQDPNSAYTLSGTTLSFTGAPPSGTNNIYVVHQAKSVGTIGIPDDTISARTLVTLDNSADHVLIEDATDGELKKALIPAASFAGIDDQSSSNDDQLTITDTAVVINEDSDDVDFRVESNGNANMLFVNGGSNLVGIASDPDLGSGLHVKTGDSGLSAANSQADDLVVESDGHTGITITSPAANQSKINFADNADDNIGSVAYNHSDDSLTFRVNDSDAMLIDSSGHVYVGRGTNKYLEVGDTSSYTSRIHSNRPGTGGQDHIHFNNGNGKVGGVLTSGTSTTYETSSDYRLKENETPIVDGIERLKQLKPYRFNFKTEPDETLDGFFAHEVQTVVPEAATGVKDEVDEEGNIDPQGIDQSKLVPLLTAALQEAITEIESLKARVTTLEE